MARHFKETAFDNFDDELEPSEVELDASGAVEDAGDFSYAEDEAEKTFSTGEIPQTEFVSVPASVENTTGFVPIVSETGSEPSLTTSKHNRRRKESAYVETDPYDIDDVRQGNHSKRYVRLISNILFVVGLLLLLAAAVMWGRSQWDYHKQDVVNERLASYAAVSDDESTTPDIDWDALKAINEDVVGWLQIPGTSVSFPVYQGVDNDQYLHTTADGEYSLGGQVFLDYQNQAPGMLDPQSIIYGHHLRNGAMFKPIADMDNQQMFDTVHTIWYVTEDKTYELEPLLLYYTDEYDTNVRRFQFSGPEELHEYLRELLSRAQTSNPRAAEMIESTDLVLTLCTCNYYDGYGRTLLLCVPKAETTTSEAE